MNTSAGTPLWRKDLIRGGRRSSRPRTAGDHENPSPDRRGAKAVARRRHARVGGPAVAGRIIGLDFAKGAGRRLAAEHEDAAAEHRGRDPTARGWHGGTRLPAVGRRVVGLVDRKILRIVAVAAAA